MAPRIYIVGGIEDDHDRESLLEKLAARTGDALTWEWIKAFAKDGWRAPPHDLNKMFVTLRKAKEDEVKVVLLKSTNKQTKNSLFQEYDEGDGPVLAPDWKSGDELIAWLVSQDAGLIPGLPWVAELRTAAFFSIVAKLLKNKSFCKDMHGHDWTQEADLLGQSPVDTPSRPEIRSEATRLLARMNVCMLITKGGSQGKTKKEWAILQTVLPAVKAAFLKRSLEPLRAIAALCALLNYLDAGDAQRYRLDDVIQEERVRFVCREPERS